MASQHHAPGVRKRARLNDPELPSFDAVLDPSLEDYDTQTSARAASSARSTASSAFRNVSACNRCRHRKNRCDQQLPACSACTKAGVKCVGFDPLTKRELPRSYVYFLETRTEYLESLLKQHNIPYETAESFALGDQHSVSSPAEDGSVIHEQPQQSAQQQQQKVDEKQLDSLVSDIGMVSVRGASDSRFLGSTSGISFARVVFAALKSAAPQSRRGSERSSKRGSRSQPSSAGGDTLSMRDSFFGLHTKPAMKQAPFPDKELGHRLVNLYFEHANPQIPTLHRPEFMKTFERVYSPGYVRTARDSYFMNIVFALGAGIIVGKGEKDPAGPPEIYTQTSSKQYQPEEYHAAAIVHLEGVLGSTATLGDLSVVSGGLEELQAVLLLAGFALLRPVAPGLWYIVGVAVRLAVDLGLHYDDAPVHPHDSDDPSVQKATTSGNESGKQQWTRDIRRRLWWCVYSFDRLVSTCVGRPFGVSDQVITTPFPTLLDDEYITPEGFTKPESPDVPSYKHVAYHYFRLRLLQSEILQVLQYQQAQRINKSSMRPVDNPFMHTQLPSPFLSNYASFKDWRIGMDHRLAEWRESAPTKDETGVAFSTLFLELNYWQAVILLYRQGLTAPAELAGHVNEADDDIGTPPSTYSEEPSDQEFVFLKMAEAGQRILKLYRQLHRMYLVNYTYLATHHLFMAGICFLYAIWHSVAVRSHLTVDDVDFTVLAATSVLEDLTEQCPPAETCRDAFAKMSKATIQMCVSTTGFGAQAMSSMARDRSKTQQAMAPPPLKRSTSRPTPANPRILSSGLPHPQFDMNLRDLFTEQESLSRPFGQLDSSNPPKFTAFTTSRQQVPTSQPQSMDATSGTDSFTTTGTQAPQQQSWFTNQQQRNDNVFQQPMRPSGPYRSNSGTNTDFYNLDFLDELPDESAGLSTATTSSGADGVNNSSAAAAAAAAAANSVDMFGMGGMGGMDMPTDWSGGVASNSGFDLFEGFFFGGGGSLSGPSVPTGSAGAAVTAGLGAGQADESMDSI